MTPDRLKQIEAKKKIIEGMGINFNGFEFECKCGKKIRRDAAYVGVKAQGGKPAIKIYCDKCIPKDEDFPISSVDRFVKRVLPKLEGLEDAKS